MMHCAYLECAGFSRSRTRVFGRGELRSYNNGRYLGSMGICRKYGIHIPHIIIYINLYRARVYHQTIDYRVRCTYMYVYNNFNNTIYRLVLYGVPKHMK